MNKEKIVYLIDDDKFIIRALSLLLKSENYDVAAFNSAEEFLKYEVQNRIGCIILDVNLEGQTGLELQEELIKRSSYLPIIFITGQGDIPMSVQALKKGAVNFLPKPFDDNQLLEAVKEGMERCLSVMNDLNEQNNAKKLIDKLTPREFEVLQYVISGFLNKQIAAELNISEQTVKIHRGKITEKLGVKSVAEIVRLAEKTGIKSALDTA